MRTQLKILLNELDTFRLTAAIPGSGSSGANITAAGSARAASLARKWGAREEKISQNINKRASCRLWVSRSLHKICINGRRWMKEWKGFRCGFCVKCPEKINVQQKHDSWGGNFVIISLEFRNWKMTHWRQSILLSHPWLVSARYHSSFL